jgi:TM2 domain-containing membrane protein YozV/RNA polymerase subunit RPABC4/transcription elongation factor Spt4
MYCRNCGREVAEQALMCVACGVPPRNGKKFCQNCGQETDPNAELCTKCGVRLAMGPPPDTARSRLAAGVLGIVLGWLGIHRFYLGYIAIGIAQIAVSLLTCGIGGFLWGFIEGILILTGSINKDADGQSLRD